MFSRDDYQLLHRQLSRLAKRTTGQTHTDVVGVLKSLERMAAEQSAFVAMCRSMQETAPR